LSDIALLSLKDVRKIKLVATGEKTNEKTIYIYRNHIFNRNFRAKISCPTNAFAENDGGE
jgi:hypothetical protein